MCGGALIARAEDTPQPAPATASEVGRSIFVVNDVDGKTGDAPARRIVVNDDIVFDEDIITGADAKAVVEFRDGSTFEVGPGAVVRIDAFIFNPEESTSSKTIQVTQGVFRYVSGYVASNQDTHIATAHGQIGIRGSLAEGIVDPAVPDFVYLGEGSASFINGAGSSALQPGNSIAVPSATTSPMAAAAMPAPVAAEALQAIEKRLPPRAALANRPAADDAWLKRTGTADLLPVAAQRSAAQAAARAIPPPGASGSTGIAAELGLLTEANRLELFNGRPGPHTPEQTAFLARAAREHPNAEANLRRFTADAHALHRQSMNAGTAFVMRGIGHAAPSAEVMHRITAASIRANPGAAGLITHHAQEAYRGVDHANRAPEHTSARKTTEPRPPAARPPPRAQRPPEPRKAAPKPPPPKQPARRKGDAKDQR